MKRRLPTLVATLAIAVAVTLAWLWRDAGEAVTAPPEEAANEPAQRASPPRAAAIPAMPSRAANSLGGSRVDPSSDAGPRSLPDYELTRLSSTAVAISLSGGPSDVFIPPGQREPDWGTTRRVRGRVRSSVGTPLSQAVVVVGPRLDGWGGSLSAEAGARTGLDGTFEIGRARTGALIAVALHATGWSPVTPVPAGSDDAVVELVVDAAGDIAGHATLDGRPERFVVRLEGASPGLGIEIETDEEGAYRFGALPAGRYRLTAALQQTIAGGLSREAPIVEVTVEAGRTTTQDFALRSGTTLVVHAVTHDSTVTMNEFFLVVGAHELPARADLERLESSLPRGSVDSMILGGMHADAVMQFHDRSPGTYTVCVATTLARGALWGCSPAAIAEGQSVREVTIEARAAR